MRTPYLMERMILTKSVNQTDRLSKLESRISRKAKQIKKMMSLRLKGRPIAFDRLVLGVVILTS